MVQYLESLPLFKICWFSAESKTVGVFMDSARERVFNTDWGLVSL